MKISPSILAADLTDLKRILETMDPEIVDLIHIDVMDGHFVPAISFGELYTSTVKKHTPIPLDVHLMVTNPDLEIPKYYDLEPFNITFHLEATNFPIRLAQEIRKRGIRAGIALNPGTPIRDLEAVLDHIDLILLMSVEPGFYGQKFIPSVLDKIKECSSMIKGREILLQVDGGIGPENIRILNESGVHISVAGSAGFKGGDVNQNVRIMKITASGDN